MKEDKPADAEPEEECAWCKFMKAGPCRKVFEGWQSCVDGVKDLVDAGSDGKGGGNHAVAEHCAAVTAPLFECMAKHRYYYGSQLDGMASNSKEHEEQRQQQQQQQEAAGVQQSPEAAARMADNSNRSSTSSSRHQQHSESHTPVNNSSSSSGGGGGQRGEDSSRAVLGDAATQGSDASRAAGHAGLAAL